MNGTIWSAKQESEIMPALREWIFISSFAILLVIHGIENTSLIYQGHAWMNIIYAIKKLIYLVLLGKIVFLSNYRLKDVLFIGITLLISIMSYLKCGDFAMVELFIVLNAGKDISTDRIATWFCSLKAVSIPMTLIGCMLGLFPALYYYNGSKGYYNTLGFCHRNVLGANIAILCLMWFMVRYKKLKREDVIMWLVIAVLSFRLAYSKSSIIIVMLSAVVIYLFKLFEEYLMNSRILFYLMIGGAVSLLIISILCTLFYHTNSAFWRVINSAFTLRFSSSNYIFEQYGLSLFGQEIPFVSSFQAQMTGMQKLILDNVYARALLYYGVIPGMMFLGIYLRCIIAAYKQYNPAVVICLLIMAVYGLSERYMMDIYYQLPLLTAYQYLFLNPKLSTNEYEEEVDPA